MRIIRPPIFEIPRRQERSVGDFIVVSFVQIVPFDEILINLTKPFTQPEPETGTLTPSVKVVNIQVYMLYVDSDLFHLSLTFCVFVADRLTNGIGLFLSNYLN